MAGSQRSFHPPLHSKYMGIPPPWQVRQGLTLKNVREICRELEVTVAAREKGSSVEQAHKVKAE